MLLPFSPEENGRIGYCEEWDFADLRNRQFLSFPSAWKVAECDQALYINITKLKALTT
jgi:hypothetical protein